MTKENWDALMGALAKATVAGGLYISNLEAAAVLHELEVLGGSGFLTTSEPVVKKPEPQRAL